MLVIELLVVITLITSVIAMVLMIFLFTNTYSTIKEIAREWQVEEIVDDFDEIYS